MLCACTKDVDSNYITEESVKQLLTGRSGRKWNFGILTQSCNSTMETDTEITMLPSGKYVVDGASNQCDWSIRIEKSPVSHKVFLLLGNDVYTILPNMSTSSLYILDVTTNQFVTATVNPNGTVNDVDGNTYRTKVINGKNWMVTNLKTTQLNDGTSITTVLSNQFSSVGTNPGMAWKNNDAAGMKINGVGAYYNYYAVQTNKLCPVGWHVATPADWYHLEQSLGGNDMYFGKKITAISENGTDDVGFNGIASGYIEGSYASSGTIRWWLNYAPNSTEAQMVGLNIWSLSSPQYFQDAYTFSVPKSDGYPVRCVED